MSFASVTTGPFVEATNAALGHDLSGLEPEPGDWTVRLLRITGALPVGALAR